MAENVTFRGIELTPPDCPDVARHCALFAGSVAGLDRAFSRLVEAGIPSDPAPLFNEIPPFAEIADRILGGSVAAVMMQHDLVEVLGAAHPPKGRCDGCYITQITTIIEGGVTRPSGSPPGQEPPPPESLGM